MLRPSLETTRGIGFRYTVSRTAIGDPDVAEQSLPNDFGNGFPNLVARRCGMSWLNRDERVGGRAARGISPYGRDPRPHCRRAGVRIGWRLFNLYGAMV